jgi:calcium binding protein 39
VAQLAQDFYDINFFGSAINHLGKLNFENRKDVVIIFSHLLRRQIGSRSPTVEYIVNKKEILGSLVLGYKDPEVA